jgi:hypothetical protein
VIKFLLGTLFGAVITFTALVGFADQILRLFDYIQEQPDKEDS